MFIHESLVIMISALLLAMGMLNGCAQLDAYNAAHPGAVAIEDDVETGAEVAGALVLKLPPETLTSTLGVTKAPTNVTTQ